MCYEAKTNISSTSPWDWSQIGTKLITKHVTYQKLDNLL